MKYFNNITSFADLKKQYRKLAVANHPDKGGSTEAMQKINGEFEKLFKIWEHHTEKNTVKTGYENDYSGTSATEYTQYVYNEYRFRGSNYKGQSPKEVCEIIRKWLKETYPFYKFSVVCKHYSSISIALIHADFEVFNENGKSQNGKQINHYHIDKDDDLTERAKEVMKNVYSQVNSYNFDDSDAMTDYFHCNFYLNLSIGNHNQPYRIVLPKLKHRGKKPEVFKRPEGQAHKTIRQALGKAAFAQYEDRRGKRTLLCEKHYYGTEMEGEYYPLYYAGRKTAQKRMEKLNDAGILCQLLGYNGGYIEFLGYTPETEQKLNEEDSLADLAEKEWNEKHLKAA
jgi:curved DNA-binding protein CbpA